MLLMYTSYSVSYIGSEYFKTLDTQGHIKTGYYLLLDLLLRITTIQYFGRVIIYIRFIH